jgi:transposase
MSSTSSPTAAAVAVGVDVSKRCLDVHLHPLDQAWQVDNTSAGIAQLLQRLQSLPIARIAVESTGGYERDLLTSLLGVHAPVALVNPRPVRSFAKGLSIEPKTDAIDARLLALYAHHVRPRLTPPMTPDREALRELVARRQQLVEAQTRQRNYLEHARLDTVRDSIGRVQQQLKTEILAIETMIQQHIDARSDLSERYEMMQSIKGVGPAIARVLVSELPELGHIDRRKLAALVGVAPFNNDSGRRQGARRIRGGRATVRRALYMAAMVAARHNLVIKPYYQKLRQRGKHRKVALVACMRKIIIHLNATLQKTERNSQP